MERYRFVCKDPMLVIKYGDKNPKDFVQFIHGEFETEKIEEAEAVRELIRSKRFRNITEIEMIPDRKKVNQKKEEKPVEVKKEEKPKILNIKK